MKSGILGIDLGTSGIKLIYNNGSADFKIREKYEIANPNGWWQALCKAAKQIDLSDVSAISLSSQVGTYIINDTDVIGWSDAVGEDELLQTLCDFSPQQFAEEISMPHPKLLSYPIPRLIYINRHFKSVKKVCMPKDFLIEKLTGNFVTDPFSWRGLANLKTNEYSELMLKYTKTEKSALPKLLMPTSQCGTVIDETCGIPHNTPVFTGCNDFFAGLLGMGAASGSKLFDITGTSEHLGMVNSTPPMLNTTLVSGPFLQNNVHYGVTASSGASLKFGMQFAQLNEVDFDYCINNNPPIFLPYLNGERAPIWDANAKGVFFGINANTTQNELAYAVLEGVSFSIKHIHEQLGISNANAMVVVGGAANNEALNRIKATLFDLPVQTLVQNDTSALGAQMIAAVGAGFYKSYDEAIADNCVVKSETKPEKDKTELINKRFEIYKSLYPALKQSFKLL